VAVSGLPRYGARRDENEREIIEALFGVGAWVTQVSQVGMPDLYVVYHDRAVWMEVKRADGKVRARQWAFILECQRRGIHAAIVRTVEDALEAIGAIH
jgi:hypothetical protein